MVMMPQVGPMMCPACRNAFSSWRALTLTQLRTLKCNICGKTLTRKNKYGPAFVLAMGLVLIFLQIIDSHNLFIWQKFAIGVLFLFFIGIADMKTCLLKIVDQEPKQAFSDEIVENDDGTFSVNGRTYNTRASAEAYVDLVKRVNRR